MECSYSKLLCGAGRWIGLLGLDCSPLDQSDGDGNELFQNVGLPVMAYFGFVQGVDGALYLVKFSVWAIFLPVGLVGLTTEMQQHLAKTPENGPLRKFASGAVDLSVLVAMIWTGHVATATAFCFYMLCAAAAREGAKKYRSEAEQSNRAAAEPSGAGA